MEISFLERQDSIAIALLLLACMILFVLLGRYTGKKMIGDKEKEGVVIGSLFGIMGLMLAFTFGMALTRHEKRIDILLNEANDIGTAILRSDLYPEPHRGQFREDFKAYVEARVSYFQAATDTHRILAAKRESSAIARRLWKRAAALAYDSTVAPVATMQMAPALNNMIDTAELRWYMSRNKVPESVVWVLFALICICSFLSGYSSSTRRMDWISTFSICLLLAAVVYLIIDMDRPRRGMITLGAANQAMLDLRGMFD